MNNGKNTMLQTGNHEHHIIYAAPCYEKKEAFLTVTFGMMLITRERMIITPISATRGDPEVPQPKGGKPPEVKPVMQPPFGPSRTRESSRLESLGLHTGDYLDRDPDEILSEEKDARVILLGEMTEIIIRRVRTDSRSSRWLSILFALYPLEPAGARYSVDYQLSIATPDREYTLITPFSLLLKQVLVDILGNRVHEIVDEYAPLL
jgi:hypothetical protein